MRCGKMSQMRNDYRHVVFETTKYAMDPQGNIYLVGFHSKEEGTEVVYVPAGREYVPRKVIISLESSARGLCKGD